MEFGSIDTTPRSSDVKRCIKRATRLRPCLCEYTSEKDAIMDVYIMNTSKRTFSLVEVENIVATGPFADQQPGAWIIKPPKTIHACETVFIRAYSGKISTTDHTLCSYGVSFTITVGYHDPVYNSTYDLDPTSFFTFEVGTTRNSEGNGCAGLQPFDPLSITDFTSNFPVVNIYSLTPQSGNISQDEQGDERWRNTAFFIIS